MRTIRVPAPGPSLPRARGRRQSLTRRSAIEPLEGRLLMAAGFLDPSFDGDGRLVRTDGAFGNAVAVQSDGKIVTAGSAADSAFFLARYNTDGSPDASFGTNGTARTNFPGSAGGTATSLAIQADGKIVAVGQTGRQVAVARFNPDGTPDASFDGDGLLTFGFGGSSAVALDVAIQPLDQRIVVAGASSLTPGDSTFAVARLMPDGSFDATFGPGGDDGDGRVTTAFGLTGASAVAIAPGNKIVAAGSADGGDGDSAIVRYNADGSLDTTFGPLPEGEGVPPGIVRNAFEAADNYDEINDVAVDADGSIVVAGHIATVGFTVVRFTDDGLFSRTFQAPQLYAGGGSAHSVARSVVIQPGGKVLAAGFTTDAQNNPENVAVVRYNADGSPDATFSLNGVALTDLRLPPPAGAGAPGTKDAATGMALAPDGSIVVAGSSGPADSATGAGAVLRYLGDRDSAPAPVTLAGGTLSMTGTDRADDIRLFPAGAGGQQFVADLTGALFLVNAVDAARVNISAGAGDDIVRALTGPTGNPLAVAMNVSGGAGNDTMTGGAGNDVLLGEDGNDALDGGRGADALLGGAGDDLILAAEVASPGTGFGDDFYAGGAGTDMITYAGRTARLNIRLGGYATGAPGERDTVRGDIERVVGGAGDDRIEGSNDDNILFGGDGNDTLVGRGGNDVLLGEAGDDVLTDYSGTNTLEGGDGNDTVNGVRETVPTVTLEAENATVVGSAVVSRSNGGYTGTGYVDFNASRGDAVEWTYDSPSAGTRTLTFRYANGGTTDRPLELKVNDTIVNPRLSFAPTGGWTTWRTVTVTVQLVAGANRIRLTSIGSNGGNIDSLTIS